MAADGSRQQMLDFSALDGVVSDMDGVLWRGDEALAGMPDLFEMLRRRGLPVALATNNSSKSEAEYVAKLAGLGALGFAERQIVTSRTVMVDYLRAHYPAGTGVYVIGTAGFAAAIAEAGFVVGETARAVVVGIDFDLTYEKLRRATLLIRAGADFLGTNGDDALPSREGLIPGNGATLAALAAATGQLPVVMGKPSAAIYEAALRRLGTTPARTLMIGDRLDTDIAGARRVGMRTALVLSGVTADTTAIADELRPDAAFAGLPELLSAWQAAVPI
jgi:4-nitrophenyl phosphatase